MHILIVEDDKTILFSLKSQLKATYLVDLAETGAEGLHKAEANRYDLILLDLNLPDTTGLTVCKAMRDAGNNAGILILTGNDSIASKVDSLDAGADDYLTKPFSVAELNARIRALLRRQTRKLVGSLVEIGDVTLDAGARTVTRAGHAIALRRKEFDLLEYLILNAGRTVTRNMILDHVWAADAEIWGNVVDVHIKNLRDKLDKPFEKRLIETVHGIGYKFIET